MRRKPSSNPLMWLIVAMALFAIGDALLQRASGSEMIAGTLRERRHAHRQLADGRVGDGRGWYIGKLARGLGGGPRLGLFRGAWRFKPQR